MTEHSAQAPEPDQLPGEDTGHEQGRSDDVNVTPGAKGPGAVSGTGAGRTAGLPGPGYHPTLPDDEADDAIGGSEPYDDTKPLTKPYEERLDLDDS